MSGTTNTASSRASRGTVYLAIRIQDRMKGYRPDGIDRYGGGTHDRLLSYYVHGLEAL